MPCSIAIMWYEVIKYTFALEYKTTMLRNQEMRCNRYMYMYHYSQLWPNLRDVHIHPTVQYCKFSTSSGTVLQ